MSRKEVTVLVKDSNLDSERKESSYSLLDEISDEYIRYDLDVEKGPHTRKDSADSDALAINERKESGDFWRTYFKEQHVITEGRTEQKRKRRANGKDIDSFGVTDWEGWWLRSTAWRRVEGLLVILTFIFALAELISAIYFFIK